MWSYEYNVDVLFSVTDSLHTIILGFLRRTPVFGLPTRSDTNWAVRPQKMARGLKFRIKEEVLYSLWRSEIEAYAKSRFSHDAAHTACICAVKA